MSFAWLRGHDRPLAAFREAWARGRLSHAYLLVGPEGIGKKGFAMELAKALLCEGRDRDVLDACDRCPACRQVEAGVHPDFSLVVRPEDKNVMPIDTSRQFQEWLALAPVHGKGKIAVVDEADLMSLEAANSILKTLEEPPAGSLLLLVATDVERFLPTIRSRCQLVSFAALAEADLIAVLTRPPLAMTEEAARQAARAADGSVAMAQRLAAPDVWNMRARVIEQVAGGDGHWQPLELAQEVLEFAKATSKLAAEHRARAELILHFAALLFRDVMACQAGGDQAVCLLEENRAAAQRLAVRLPPSVPVRLVRRTLEARAHIRRYANLALVLDVWLTDVADLLSGCQPAAIRRT